MPIIMGTAGHIDHGKTTLVKALTGIDCDRLSEEKKRGITIELGFAYLDLPGGERLGIVDVPGHEKFVKNMVAGAAGIDFVMLVIAADEGVMPQTREHLEICTLLGTKVGLVALTKADMVDEEWLELVTEDVSGFLEGTFLEGAPIMPVSSHTGQGLDELRAKLAEIAGGCEAGRRSDLFRLPVDRVFTIKGHGTVVTGTLVSGHVKVGDDLVVYPEGSESKVRGLQWHGSSVEKVDAGQRTAMNLSGLEVEDLKRGDVLAAPGALFPSEVWDVELNLLKSTPKPLKHRKEVHFHHGSREVLARVHFLDREQLVPGESCVCQIRFPEPMVGVYGDRIVLRSFSPLRTIGGGKILSPMGRRIKRFSDEVQKLGGLIEAAPEDLVLRQLDMAGNGGLSFAELLVLTNLETKALTKILNDFGGKQKALCFDKESKVYVSGEVADRLSDECITYLSEFHKKDPMKPGISRGELASSWGRELKSKLFHFLVERLLKQQRIASEQEIIRLPDHKVSLASDQEKLKSELLKAYEKGGITPPNLKDVLNPLDLAFKEAAPVFRLLTDSGELVKIKEEMYYHRSGMEQVLAMVEKYFEDHDDLGPAEMRDLTGLSRKFVIPLLEYMDKERITIRVGDKRVLRGKK